MLYQLSYAPVRVAVYRAVSPATAPGTADA